MYLVDPTDQLNKALRKQSNVTHLMMATIRTVELVDLVVVVSILNLMTAVLLIVDVSVDLVKVIDEQ
jgi:hypothetical protein